MVCHLGSGKSPRVSKDAVDDGGNNAKNDVNGNEYVAALVEPLVFPERHDSRYFTASSFLLSTLDRIAYGHAKAGSVTILQDGDFVVDGLIEAINLDSCMMSMVKCCRTIMAFLF